MNTLRMIRVTLCLILSVLATATFGTSSAAANEKLRVGEHLPGFSLPRADNPRKQFTSKDLLGKPSIIIFWRPGQELSSEAITDLQQILRDVGASRLKVVAVDTAQSPAEDVVAAMDKLELTFPILLDAERVLYGEVGVIVAPTTLMFDAEGVLRFAMPTRPPQYARVISARARYLVGDIDEDQMNQEVNPTLLTVEHDRAAAWRMYNLGKKAQAGGETDKAIGLFERSLTQYPTLVESRCALGFLKFEAGKWDEAGSQFEFALAQQPTLALALLGRAAVLSRTGSTADAEQLLLSLLEHRSIAIRTRYELGRIYDQRGETDKASKYFQAALIIMFPEPEATLADDGN